MDKNQKLNQVAKEISNEVNAAGLGNRRSADYNAQRTQVPDAGQTKSSQMSVSISVQNQSMKDLGARAVISSEASHSMVLRDKYSNQGGNNIPVDLAILDKELADEERKR